MTFSLAQIIVWIIVGLIGGTLAGALIRRDRAGFGIGKNLAIGLIGAMVGGLLFRIFNVLPALEQISISARDVLAALAGSLIFLLAMWIWEQFQQR